jgi:hypothetical protein
MTHPPDLHDLIDPDGSPEERARLERTHELLVAAGPPPVGDVPEPPRERAAVIPLRRRRRLVELSAVAAAVLVAVGAGYLLGARGNGFDEVATIPMHGVAPATAASADLAIGETDANGNVPIEMRVSGLPSLPRGGWYELYLSKEGKLGASCGTFQTAGAETTVRLNVGYTLADWHDTGRYDGWVVTAHVPGEPQSGKQILLTT